MAEPWGGSCEKSKAGARMQSRNLGTGSEMGIQSGYPDRLPALTRSVEPSKNVHLSPGDDRKQTWKFKQSFQEFPVLRHVGERKSPGIASARELATLGQEHARPPSQES